MAPLARIGDAPTRSLIDGLRAQALHWFPEKGVGFYPVRGRPESIYDAEYIANYAALAETPIGRKLNALRVAMVRRHHKGSLTDIGIGAGTFIEAHGAATGYDVSPAAAAWLRARELFHDMRAPTANAEAATFWDSLEHIEDFDRLLARVRRFAFVSLPIFDGPAHVLGSKHYKRDEHCWYFTKSGLLTLLARLGWTVLEVNDAETKAGRDGILSFAFRREEWKQC